MKILGLEKFGIAENRLSSNLASVNFKVKIHFNYFNDSKILKPLTPKERRLLISRKFREQLKDFKSKIPFNQFEIIGSRIKPRGLHGTLTGKQLSHLRKSLEIQNIFIESAEGYKQLDIKEEPKYFSVQALFAAVVEGYDYTNSIQLTEERILLVQAKNIDEAEKVAGLEFEEYTSGQHLNSDYRYVHWKFVRYLDVYETDFDKINPKGTEIFSQMRRQKVNKTT